MDESRPPAEVLPPPEIIGSLRKGFDAIAAHISAILLPLALDLLLWLGPRLSMDRFALKLYPLIAAQPGLVSGEANTSFNNYQQFFQQFNLFMFLRTFPIGVFSLMTGKSGVFNLTAGKMPTESPLGSAFTWHIDSLGVSLGAIALLVLFGWILGALYFSWIAALVIPSSPPAIPQAILQTLLYSVVCAIFAVLIGLPLAAIILFFYLLNPLIAQVAILILSFLSIWVIAPFFFSPHGMFVRRQNALISILSSFEISRLTLPTSSLFVLTILLIGFGLNYLWALPSMDSWFTLVGILGHAFITTALLASSFIYYHDLNDWLQHMLQRLRPGFPTQRI